MEGLLDESRLSDLTRTGYNLDEAPRFRKTPLQLSRLGTRVHEVAIYSMC